MSALRLQIPSIPDNIRLVESFIDQARDEFAFDDSVYGNIMVAVTETVNNAILHGNKQDVNKIVQLDMEVTEENVRFTIRDQGEGFDHNSLPDPTAPENLLELGGRGIFIIRNLADEVEFVDHGREVQLVFFLNDPALG
ncbi:MAG: ATP-binding protein [Bernardetiaceae bacterium]|jgi:serine/threonine-protein kinase RsbW|nr:ATP-binding protein [Bernardetiaceae bacterium]